MSYARLRRIVREENASLRFRYRALRQAMESYSWLTRTSFESIADQLRNRHALVEGAPSLPAMRAAFDELEHAREVHLRALVEYAARRRAEKRRGIRVPSRAGKRELVAAIVLGFPR